MEKKQQGFSLLELLASITIITIMYAAAMPKIEHIIDKAKSATALVELGSIRTAIMMYELDHNSLPNNLRQIYPTYITKDISSAYTYNRNQRKICVKNSTLCELF